MPSATPRAAEVMEGRGLAKGNADQQNALRTQSRESAHRALDRVRQVARKHSTERFDAKTRGGSPGAR